MRVTSLMRDHSSNEMLVVQSGIGDLISLKPKDSLLERELS